MDAIEAIQTINSWRRVLVEGEPTQLDLMLEDVQKKLEERGWSRRPELEAKTARSHDLADRFRCFVGGSQSGPQLMLGLTRVSKRRVRGGAYSLLSAGDPIAVAGVVEDVIKNIITPCASNRGLKATVPRLGYVSQIPPKTTATLYRFTDLAAGTWPLADEADRAWRQFVTTSSRENAAFDVDELMDWFVTNGWSSGDARKLTDRYLNEAALLAEYEEA